MSPLTAGTHRSTAARTVVVMNPGSGGGKVARFRLVERVEAVGAHAELTGADRDAASLARLALANGAEVLGVAGGDGTVSAVAAVTAEARCPLVVLPAGTRNHFARDLGLDIRNPVPALDALRDGELVRVDVGRIGSRVFVNNVSFGAYADALLTPGYRQAKGRTLASIAPRYLDGQQWVPAGVDTPEGIVENPQLVLVSNNAYHLSTPRYLGRRFSLATGLLGAIVVKRPADPPPPDLLPRLRRELREHGSAGPPGEGAIVWSAARITMHGPGARLTAGIDGEPVLLDLPLVCDIRPGLLQILLPRQRPGILHEPVLRRARVTGRPDAGVHPGRSRGSTRSAAR